MAIVDGKIRCSRCKVFLDLERYTPSRVKRGSGTCKKCMYQETKNYISRNREIVNERVRNKRKRLNEKHRERARKYYERNKEKFKNQFLKSRYGISLSKYNEILLSQKGKCAICSRERASEKGYCLFVDHCHRTGIIRGLLCYHCNTGIGCFGDSLELITRARDYLKKEN